MLLRAEVLVFDQVEVLDFAGPFEVLAAAGRSGATEVVVETVGLTAEVTCRGGLVVRPARLIPAATADADDAGERKVDGAGAAAGSALAARAAPGPNLLIVPGGPGARTLVADKGTPGREQVLGFVRRRHDRGAIVAGVCTGAFILAEAGLLDGKRVTTHHRAAEQLQGLYPALNVVGGRFIDEGSVLTAGGVSSGIDLSIHLVRRLLGPEAERYVLETVEWPPGYFRMSDTRKP